MFPRRRTGAAIPRLLLILAAFCLGPYTARAQAEESCAAAGDIAVLASPMTPWTGMPFRVLFVTDKPIQGELALIAPDGSVAATSHERKGGPPYFWYAEVKSPAAGTWRVKLEHAPAECSKVTREFTVHKGRPSPPHANGSSVWPLRNSWNRSTENLYSAWLELLFDAPVGQDLTWTAMDKVMRDRSRNFLFDYFGLNEDKIAMRPDCADFPYFLRTYFSFKLGLPFGYSMCSRGFGGHPPRCPGWRNILEAASSQGLVSSFRQYLQTVADGVQTGNGRTLATDNNSDLYPVPLTQEALRPGTVFADPYGHFLTLVRRVPQSGSAAGVYLAVDAEPDGTVTRKRFWRGNFLFVNDPKLGSPGFKRFRPIVRAGNGRLRRLTNNEIAKDKAYGDFSLEQSKLSVEAFYDKMDDVMSPEPLDPALAMKSAITSLEEQVQTRVVAVENGRKYQSSHPGEVGMPDGAAIFATTGPWEDFSTPARDFRLLIAIDVVRNFPERVARRANRYAMPPGKSAAEVTAELKRELASELAARKFSYKRSDGSSWTLTLKDVLDRATELEMAYNPNDCVELRWAAAPKSKEAATCRRHAPASQRAKMSKYRPWFRERHWPAHS